MAVGVKKEIILALENRPGQLAHVCKCLSDWKVNILATSVADTTDLSIIRLIVDKPGVVVKNFKESGPFTVTERDVLLIELPNRPGELAKATKKLAARRINIDYIYGTTSRKGVATLVLAVSSPRVAAKALRQK